MRNGLGLTGPYISVHVRMGDSCTHTARFYSTEVGPPERDKTDGPLGLNDVWVGGCSAIYDGNPLVDVRTSAGHADVRLGKLWNRHVWKKDTRDTRGSVY